MAMGGKEKCVGRDNVFFLPKAYLLCHQSLEDRSLGVHRFCSTITDWQSISVTSEYLEAVSVECFSYNPLLARP